MKRYSRVYASVNLDAAIAPAFKERYQHVCGN